jgi:hypothetical protein
LNGAAGTSPSITVTAPKITPTLTVTPAFSSITPSQSLTVAVSVTAANPSSQVYGTAVLTSGAYTSMPMAFFQNYTGFTVPAGALPIGADTLTVSFTPDPVLGTNYASTSATTKVIVGTVLKPVVTPVPTTSTITSAQSLWVGVAVNQGNGSQFPTGTVTLSSASYTSSGSTLTYGQTSILIPAGSLAIGTDTITASYTPDSASAALYGSSSGTVSVTVSAPAELAPAITAKPSSTSITTAQALTIAVGITGGSGNPIPTGSVTLTGGGYSAAPMSLANGAATINVPAGSLATGVDALTVSYSPDGFSASTYVADSINIPVNVVTAGQATKPTMVLNLSSTSITTSQSLTVSATVSGENGFPTPTGSVSLTGGGYASAATALSGGNASFIIPAGSLAIGTDTLAIAYTPDSASSATYLDAAITTYVTVTATPAAVFTIAGTALTIAPGATTGNASTITVTPSGGFTGSVVLSAAITSSPAGAEDLPTFSFGSTSPVSVTGVAAGTGTLTITTTSSSSAARGRSPRPGVRWHAVGSATLACILLFGIPARRRKCRGLLAMFALLVILAGGMLACGGGGSVASSGGGGASNSGTTAGAYTITVTGVAGATTETGTMTLTVQ